MTGLVATGLANAAVATLLAVVVWAMDRLVRRPALAHAMWTLVLLKLLAPPLLVAPIAISWAHDFADQAPFAAAAADSSPAAAFPDHRLRAAVLTFARQHGWTILAAAWGAGSLAWLVLLGCRVRRFARLLRWATPAPGGLQRTAAVIARRLEMASPPGVWLLPGAVTPLVWCLGGPPRLILPSDLLERLTPAQQATLIAHELAHVRRRDHWVRWLELAVMFVYWWHPVAWWARSRLRLAEEQCCDAWVVWSLPSSARAYAGALLETVDFLAGAPAAAVPAASALGDVEDLRVRLAEIMKPTFPRALPHGGWWGVVAAGALILPLAPGLADNQRRDPPATASSDPAPLLLASAERHQGPQVIDEQRESMSPRLGSLENRGANSVDAPPALANPATMVHPPAPADDDPAARFTRSEIYTRIAEHFRRLPEHKVKRSGGPSDGDALALGGLPGGPPKFAGIPPLGAADAAAWRKGAAPRPAELPKGKGPPDSHPPKGHEKPAKPPKLKPPPGWQVAQWADEARRQGFDKRLVIDLVRDLRNVEGGQAPAKLSPDRLPENKPHSPAWR
jgi:beta-lactamase regulating signal transducer with metallopeptidase domain